MVSRLDQSLNTKAAGYRSSTMMPPAKPERLFKSDEHELEPPVATASSMTRRPAFIEQSEAAIDTKYGAGIRYRGTEYLTNLTTYTGANTGRGQILYALPISPQILSDTRLKLACQMYTRYIFKSIKFYYSGTAPTTTAGSLMMFGDYDPSQNPGSSPGDAALRYSFTHNCAEFSVWQQAQVEVNDKVYADMLYCDPDEELRWSVQGCFWVLSSGGILTGLELGKLIVEYEIDFAIPDYRGVISVLPISQATITVAAGSAGSVIQFTPGSAPPRGAVMLRIDQKNTGGDVTFNVSPNAYNQGAAPITLSPGQMFFCSTNTGATTYRPLWTPDLYALSGADQVSIVYAATTGAPTTYNVTIFPITSVTND